MSPFVLIPWRMESPIIYTGDHIRYPVRSRCYNILMQSLTLILWWSPTIAVTACILVSYDDRDPLIMLTFGFFVPFCWHLVWDVDWLNNSLWWPKCNSCLAHRGSTASFRLLQCSSGVVRQPKDLQHVVSVESSSLFHHSIYPWFNCFTWWSIDELENLHADRTTTYMFWAISEAEGEVGIR